MDPISTRELVLWVALGASVVTSVRLKIKVNLMSSKSSRTKVTKKVTQSKPKSVPVKLDPSVTDPEEIPFLETPRDKHDTSNYIEAITKSDKSKRTKGSRLAKLPSRKGKK
jgi:hypothetical protein